MYMNLIFVKLQKKNVTFQPGAACRETENASVFPMCFKMARITNIFKSRNKAKKIPTPIIIIFILTLNILFWHYSVLRKQYNHYIAMISTYTKEPAIAAPLLQIQLRVIYLLVPSNKTSKNTLMSLFSDT